MSKIKMGKTKKREEAAEIGDNSGAISGKRLNAFIERIERLEDEKKALAEDISDVYGEAKSTGFDVKIMRKVVRLRKMNAEKRREEEELVSLYCSAIGLA